MDVHNIISSFCASGSQYTLNQSEDDLNDFQRHFEMLVCVTSENDNLLILQKHPLLTQCITNVINVLLDCSAKKSLITRAFTLLQNLLKDPVLFKTLQSFHLHSALSNFLQNYGVKSRDSLVILCFTLLEESTYGIKVEYIENHFENLLSVLANMLCLDSTSFFKVFLHVLSNLCRHNPKVQSFLCSLPNIKQVVKKLISSLTAPEQINALYALSVLSSISPYNQVSCKLWTENHLMLTFELIIKFMFCENGNYSLTAVDLFSDLFSVPNNKACFLKSQSFGKCIRTIAKHLSNATSKQVLVYLKFIHIISDASECLGKLNSILCVPVEQSEKSQIVGIHPMLSKWCCINMETSLQIPTLSLQIVKVLLHFYTNNNFNVIERSVRELLKELSDSLNALSLVTDRWEEILDYLLEVFEVWLLLFKTTSLNCDISQYISVKICEEVAYLLLSKTSAHLSQPEMNLFLMVCETIGHVHSNDEVFFKILNKNDSMQFISQALMSDDNEQIKRSLFLISQSQGKCSLDILSENLKVRNSILQKSLESCWSDDSQPKAAKKPHLNCECERSVDMLLNRIENGLQIKDVKSSEIMDLYEHKIAMKTLKEQELQSYVDAKAIALQEADKIITQYKCRQVDLENEALRLRYLIKEYEAQCENANSACANAQDRLRRAEEDACKSEQRVVELEKNLVEQRELMQTQMNRLYEQKRGTEEEKEKLTSLVAAKEQEKKQLHLFLQQTEEEVRLKDMNIKELESSKFELEVLLEEGKKVAEKAKASFEQRKEQMEKAMNTLQQTVASLEEKHESVVNEMARKVDSFERELSDMKDDRDRLDELVKLKDAKIEDLHESLRKANDTYGSKISKLQDSYSKQKVSLEQTEAKRSKLQQEKQMLELLCKKYEASIEEKDSQIQNVTSELEVVSKESKEVLLDREKEISRLKEELKKLEYITGMIRNLTNGTISSPQ